MRPLAAAAFFVALAAWPLRDAVRTGTVAGAGPDVASTLWAMWWFSQEWAGAAWGGRTELVNYPGGAIGTVLSPVTATLWSVLVPLLGEMAAATWTDILYLAGFAFSVAALARAVGLPPAASLLAGSLVFVQRYLVFAVGETSIVGITGITVPIGLYALLRGGPAWTAVFAACVALTGIEMPYLVMVLPLAAVLGFRRPQTYVGLAVGVVGLGVFALLHRGTQDQEFGLMTAVGRVGIGSLRWMVIEAPWARSAPDDLFLPGEVLWSLDARASKACCGRDYLGLTVVLLALVGVWARPRTWGWAALGFAGAALATGSDWAGLPGPFAILNAVFWWIARGLTQPTRFLLLPAIGLSICAAAGVHALWTRHRALGLVGLGALAADGFLFGGLALRLPTTTIASPPCVEALRDDGPGGVLLWPWDGLRGSDGVLQRVLQVAHRHPTPGFGVGSWKMLGDRPQGMILEKLGWPEAVEGTRPLDVAPLVAQGYRWVVVDTGAAAAHFAEGYFGRPVGRCEGLTVHELY